MKFFFKQAKLQQIIATGRNGKSQGQGMLRLLGAAQRRDVKATQNLSRIVIFFIICWFPLYTINAVEAFRSDYKFSITILDLCIILSHLNSVGNPLLYAYHLKVQFNRFFIRALFSNLFYSREIKFYVDFKTLKYWKTNMFLH